MKHVQLEVLHQLFMNYNPCHSVRQRDSLSNKDRYVETDTDFTIQFFLF